MKRLSIRFIAGLVGVAATSSVIVWATRNIALYFSVSEIIIGSTIVALGTSLPEISTCITAALKKEGDIAVGNIIGADILNILWIIGVASLANPITVDLDIINFAFPYMILIVVVMLVSMRIGCRLGKIKRVNSASPVCSVYLSNLKPFHLIDIDRVDMGMVFFYCMILLQLDFKQDTKATAIRVYTRIDAYLHLELGFCLLFPLNFHLPSFSASL